MYKMEDDEREGLGCFGAATENILVPQFTSIFACQLPLLPCSTAEQLHGPIPREDVKRMKDEVLANSNFWLSTAEDALEFTRTGFVGGHLFRGHVRGDTTKVLQDIQRRTKQVRSDTALGQERVFFTCFAPPRDPPRDFFTRDPGPVSASPCRCQTQGAPCKALFGLQRGPWGPQGEGCGDHREGYLAYVP